MLWIAPSEKDTDTAALEKRLAADQSGGEPSGAHSTTGTVARRVSASDSANQFYTPSSIVRLLTEVIEPYHGRILDPACGSGGMFVSSARFVSEHKRRAAADHGKAINAFNSFSI